MFRVFLLAVKIAEAILFEMNEVLIGTEALGRDR